MGKRLHLDPRAEQEANEAALRFMDSSDVVGDMSRAYGRDLSSVRIHTGEDAARRVAPTGADAFSTGRDIFFGRGAFDQSDPASRGLLAHELTHSLQQGIGGEGTAQSAPVSQTAPQGAAQGGLLDWFRKKFSKKPMQISSPISVQVDTSPEAREYQRAYRRATRNQNLGAGQIANRLPSAQVGQTNMAELGALQSLFHAPGQTIDTSNTQFRNTQGTDNLKRSAALQALGLRGSSSQEAKADKKVRGSLLSGFNNQVLDYVTRMDNAGFDFSTALNGTEKHQPENSPGAYVAGGQLDQINSDMLSMLSEYFLSDQGAEYLGGMADTIKDADVFGGNTRDALSYMLQSVMTSTGASYMYLKGDAGKDLTYQQDTSDTIREASRTLMVLPSLARLDDDVIRTLPPGTQGLLRQFNTLLDQLQAKLAQG